MSHKIFIKLPASKTQKRLIAYIKCAKEKKNFMIPEQEMHILKDIVCVKN